MALTKTRPIRWRWILLVLLVSTGALIATLANQIEQAVLSISQNYANWLSGWTEQGEWTSFALPIIAFGGGLIASVSPCVLALLPIQLSYLGAQQNRRANTGKVLQFSLGVICAYSILGYFTSLAGALIIDYRGILLITTGTIVIAMALQLQGWGPNIPWHRLTIRASPDPHRIKNESLGAFVIGLTFALVTSPCASPVLAAVLSAAATVGSPILAAACMVLYAIGYSMVILLAGLGVELGGLRQRLLKRGKQISAISAATLFVFGVIYLWTGIQDLQLQSWM